GSFEADRRYIPSRFKPIQTHLTGWITEVIAGNEITLDSLKSPVLNYFNSQTDRKFVIGEKSLNISDNIQFKRRVYQTISSTPYVELADGNYTLSAKIKNGVGFQVLEMYAESGMKKFSTKIKEQNTAWTTIELKNIQVKGGKVEIGFWAEGLVESKCQLDDVMLVKKR
ncbi:MAG TPA: hypothetical protein P5084_10855, partial [Paludibacter sp.]|nr:hypothetical protein [Paludibacter sp.]